MTAFANKITPTDVAYFLIEKFENFHAVVVDLSLRLESAIQNRLQSQEDRLNNLWAGFNHRVMFLVEQNKSQLQLYGERLQNHAKRFLDLQQNRINELKSGLGYKPEAIVLRENDKLNRLTGMLESVSKQHIKNSVLKLEHVNAKLNLLKPENILKRGYSITLLNGKPLISADKLKPGNRITTQLYRGTVESEVTSKK
jgi:exodeoxyribonuclease VII large subunit